MNKSQIALPMKTEEATSLDSLLADPTSIAALQPETAERLLISLATIQPILIQRALARSLGSDDSELLTTEEVAQKLKISEDKAYELVRNGSLQSVRMGRLVRVKPSSLTNYISRNTH
jgi:excisionase family DNA binding protein